MYDRHKPGCTEDAQEGTDPYPSLSALAEQLLGAGRARGGGSGSSEEECREASAGTDIPHPAQRTPAVMPSRGGGRNHASDDDTPDLAESPLNSLSPANAGGDNAPSMPSGGSRHSSKRPRRLLPRLGASTTPAAFPLNLPLRFFEHDGADKAQGELGNNITSARKRADVVLHSSPLKFSWDVSGMGRPEIGSVNYPAASTHPLPPPGAWGTFGIAESIEPSLQAGYSLSAHSATWSNRNTTLRHRVAAKQAGATMQSFSHPSRAETPDNESDTNADTHRVAPNRSATVARVSPLNMGSAVRVTTTAVRLQHAEEA